MITCLSPRLQEQFKYKYVMAHVVKLSDKIVDQAKSVADSVNRSVGGQIEYWAKMGKMAEENPDVTHKAVKELLIKMG